MHTAATNCCFQHMSCDLLLCAVYQLCQSAAPSCPAIRPRRSSVPHVQEHLNSAHWLCLSESLVSAVLAQQVLSILTDCWRHTENRHHLSTTNTVLDLNSCTPRSMKQCAYEHYTLIVCTRFAAALGRLPSVLKFHMWYQQCAPRPTPACPA